MFGYEIWKKETNCKKKKTTIKQRQNKQHIWSLHFSNMKNGKENKRNKKKTLPLNVVEVSHFKMCMKDSNFPSYLIF
jgi:endonuclease IV